MGAKGFDGAIAKGTNSLFRAVLDATKDPKMWCQTIVGEVGIIDPKIGFFCIVDNIDDGVKGLMEVLAQKMRGPGLFRQIMPPTLVEDDVPIDGDEMVAVKDKVTVELKARKGSALLSGAQFVAE